MKKIIIVLAAIFSLASITNAQTSDAKTKTKINLAKTKSEDGKTKVKPDLAKTKTVDSKIKQKGKPRIRRERQKCL